MTMTENEKIKPEENGPTTYPQKCRGIIGFLFGHKFSNAGPYWVCLRCGMVPHD